VTQPAPQALSLFVGRAIEGPNQVWHWYDSATVLLPFQLFANAFLAFVRQAKN
jgi:hypothetical protein